MKILNTDFPILLVDDDSFVLEATRELLGAIGIDDVETISKSLEVMPFLSGNRVSMIFLDLSMPYISGEQLLDKLKRDYPHIPVVIMTSNNDLDKVVECTKKGAFNYIVKPVSISRLTAVIRMALEVTNLREELSTLKVHMLGDKLEHEAVFSAIITQDKKIFAIFRYMEAIAVSQHPVLITGETGVGKELFAKAMHEVGMGAGNFVAVNTAGLDDTMFSDTLFGHEKGAFTGADRKREGFISQAAGGTLFLDEIGDLSEQSQVKLLRLLEERTYYPLGSDTARKSEARIVVATNKDIKQLVEKGKFRNDLYYRLCTHHIAIPPLRERQEDISLLATYFLSEAAEEMNKSKPVPPPELFTLLETYHFPGNVRELRALVYDAVSQHKTGLLAMESFIKALGGDKGTAKDISLKGRSGKTISLAYSRFPTMAEVQDRMIDEAIKFSKGNKSLAASILGITRQGLYKRLNKEDEPQDRASD